MNDALQHLLVELLVTRLAETVDERSGGHCLRVDDLPTPAAEAACQQLASKLTPPDLAVVVTGTPSKTIHRTPTQVVELRNRSDYGDSGGVLVTFVPPKERLTVEDSIGSSTFERFSVDFLGESAWAHVLDELRSENEVVSNHVALVGELMSEQRDLFGIDQADLASFALEASRLARQGDLPDKEVVGAALPVLGLLPDSLVVQDDPDATRRRLELNAQQMNTLSQPIAPADRIRQLPLDPEDARDTVDALLRAVAAGTTEARQIASVLAQDAEIVDLARWEQVGQGVLTPDRFEVVRLLGAEHVEGEWTVTDERPSLGVEFICEPAANRFPDASLRLDVLALDPSGEDDGSVVRFEKKQGLPAKAKASFRKKLTCGSEESDLRPGLYRCRLSLLSHDGSTLTTAESSYFRVGDIEATVPQLDAVRDAFEARLRALTRFKSRVGTAELTFDGTAHEVEHVHVRFAGLEGARWPIQLDARLLEIESDLVLQPDALRGRTVDLLGSEPEFNLLVFEEPHDDFLEARRRLFQLVAAECARLHDSAGAQPSLAFVDLIHLEDAVTTYVESWVSALADVSSPSQQQELLETDRVELRENGALLAVMLAPTHPLRLAWRLRRDAVARRWHHDSDDMESEDLLTEAADLLETVPGLVGDELPLVLTHEHEAFRYRNAIIGGWAVYEPVEQSGGALAISRWLGHPDSDLRRSGERELAARVHAYVESHPYVRTLVLNVVQDGRGDFVLRLLGDLATRHEDLRFLVRFFGEAVSSLLGQALEGFMTDPDGAALSRNAADRLTRAGGDPLRPRLAFSKHTFDELRFDPSAFPAHITVFLDYFEAQAKTSLMPAAGRSLFAGGLISGARSSFGVIPDLVGTPPRWVSMLVPDAESTDLVQLALSAHEEKTAETLGTETRDAVPCLRLELDVRTQAILDAVHDASDWVVIIDSIFSDQYLDREPDGDVDSERYVVDVRDVRSTGESRNVVVSSKLRREQATAMAEAARHFGIPVDDSARALLLDGLHVLGAGLGLRLLADNSRRIEALSLSLASNFLSHQGFLRHALLIPLDEYSDLFAEAQRKREVDSGSRTDLLIVRLDPNERRIDTTLVEVKVRDLGPGGAVPQGLADEIADQLTNTEPVVAERLFAASLRQRPDSLAAALRLRRLAEILRKHLRRAVRHGFMEPAEAGPADVFLDHLDRGLRLSLNRRGLIFNVGGAGVRTQQLSGVDLDVVGTEEILQLLDTKRLPTAPPGEGDYLRTVFAGRGHEVLIRAEAGEPGVDEVVVDEPDTDEVAPDPETRSAVALEDVDLVGRSSESRQFSVIGTGHATGRPVAIDVGGTNVISLFGVQGSGKSYTAGALVEAGLVAVPEFGPLPRPLATVVFHYSGDSSYLSEFAAMGKPAEAAVDTPWAGSVTSSPRGIEDIVVLVPGRQVERRRSDYSDLSVERLAISPVELTTADWKLLMGIEGGKQMYAKSLNQVLKRLGPDFGVRDLKAGIEDSDLSTAQKALAQQRLEFVEDYLEDGVRIVQHLRPGRLVVVDIRDEYIDKEEALALFMVLLNRFAEAQRDAEHFNKMIVFDEAHKYMSDTVLTEAITEAVREMRHKGVTLVVASQDPPSIPPVILELSTVIIAHRMTAPTWLKHLQKHNAAFGEVKSGQVAQLRPGQALLWSSGGANRYRQPERFITRQRLSRHGGGTVRAED